MPSGAPWSSASDVETFCREVLGAEVEGDRPSALGHWTIALRAGGRASVSLSSEWGTAAADAIGLLDAGLNQRLYTVTDRTEDGRRVRNDTQTIAARDKQDAIATRFVTWVWEDAQRAQRLADRYNVIFSSVVVPAHDDGHLSLPGLAEKFGRIRTSATPSPASSPTAARSWPTPVGAGKIATMVMTAMEQRRLGSVTKPAVLVPNQMLERRIHGLESKLDDARAELDVVGHEADRTKTTRTRLQRHVETRRAASTPSRDDGCSRPTG